MVNVTSNDKKSLQNLAKTVAPAKTDLPLDVAQQLLVSTPKRLNSTTLTGSNSKLASRNVALSQMLTVDDKIELQSKLITSISAGRRDIGLNSSSDRNGYVAAYRFGFGMSQNDLDNIRLVGWRRWVDDQVNIPLTGLQAADFLQGFGSTILHQQNYWKRKLSYGALSQHELVSGAGGYYGGVVGTPGNTDPNVDWGSANMHMTLIKIWQRESALFLRHAATTNYPILMNWAMFWTNHFAIDFSFKTESQEAIQKTMLQHSYFSDIAKLSLGKFEDLLIMVAKHPAMMMHLNLDISTRQGYQGSQGANQNYARELMELHTVGLESGYDGITDVQKVAALLTGWRIRRGGTLGTLSSLLGVPAADVGQFYFDPAAHDNNARQISFGDIKFENGAIGGSGGGGGVGGPTTPPQSNPNEGLTHGETFLRALARSRFTATRIANKLIAYYYTPDMNSFTAFNLRDRLVATYMRTQGDLRAVLTELVAGGSAASPISSLNPVRPMEYLIRLLRVKNDMVKITPNDYQWNFDTHMRYNWVPYMRYWTLPGYAVNYGRGNRDVQIASQNMMMLHPVEGLIVYEISRLGEAWGFQRDVRGYIPGINNIDGLQLVNRVKLCQAPNLMGELPLNMQAANFYNQAIGPLGTVVTQSSTAILLSRLNSGSGPLLPNQIGNSMGLTAVMSSIPMINRG